MKYRIKEFRSWDWSLKRMAFWTLNDLCNHCEHTLGENGPSALEEWMECTGLKDCKGNKIYEGDIVYISGIGNYFVQDAMKNYDDLLNAIVEKDIGEILGNIYENEELEYYAKA